MVIIYPASNPVLFQLLIMIIIITIIVMIILKLYFKDNSHNTTRHIKQNKNKGDKKHDKHK